MFSIRSLARSAPRSLARCSAPPMRTFLSVPKPSPLQKTLSILPVRTRAAFSTVSPRFQDQEGSVDSELSAKLQSELQNEREATASDDLPPHLKEYLDSSPFELNDTAGVEEVVLTRKFGNEIVRVTFSIADLSMLDQDPDQFREDNGMFDEDLEGEGKEPAALNQGGSPDAAPTAPEDRVAPADRAAASDDADAASSSETSFPAHMNITIEKAGAPGALHVEAVARDGTVAIESAYFFRRAAHAEAKTAEDEWARRALYSGPPFGNLDEDLQVLLERYIEERGINTALALWVPDYIDYKEQREYLHWLSDVQDFVDA